MPRYAQLDVLSFERLGGETVAVTDIRPLEITNTLFKLPLDKTDDSLDQIASKQDVYGDEAESLAYKLADVNASRIVDSGFNIAKVRELNIPQQE